MLVCDKRLVDKYCNGKDVKPVQLRSRTTGHAGANLFNGELCNMCSECRKVNRGLFKLVK